MARMTSVEVIEQIKRSELIDSNLWKNWQNKNPNLTTFEPEKIVAALVRDELLTVFQARHLLAGKSKGFIINGKYKILDLLGTGGMGKVFLCDHMALKMRVAVKILPAKEMGNKESVERFYREARAFATLNHPNLVRGFDVDTDGKLHYIVMEYVNGPTLQELVSRNGPLEYRLASNLIRQACLGLQHAHEKGWVHRDLKPSNLIVNNEGAVKILDLGLARLLDDRNDQLTSNLSPNTIMGTADFISPEQSQDTQSVDIRGDIYSLGCTLFTLLVGKPPFAEGSTMQKLLWHQVRPMPAVTQFRNDVPEELNQIVQKMLAKNPSQRFQTPKDVVEALTPFSDSSVEIPQKKNQNDSNISSLSNKKKSVGSAISLVAAHPLNSDFSKSATTEPLSQKNHSAEKDKPTVTNLPRNIARNPDSKETMNVSENLDTDHPVSIKGGTNSGSQRVFDSKKSSVNLDSNFGNEPGSRPSTGSISVKIAGNLTDVSKKINVTMGQKIGKKLAVASLVLVGLIAIIIGYRWLSYDPYQTLMNQFSNTELILNESEEGPIQIVSGRASRVKVIYRSAEGKTASTIDVDVVRTISQAISQAKDGTRICLLGETVIGEIDVDGANSQVPKRISLIAKGTNGSLSLRSSSSPEKPTISLKSVQGWTIRGINFEGGISKKSCLKIIGNCPGLKVEDCSFGEFADSSVVFENASGDPDEPIRLTRLKWSNSKEAVDTLIRIDRPDGEGGDSKHISIQESEFVGHARSAVHIRGSASYVELKQNRFYNVGEALKISGDTSKNKIDQLRLNFSSNTVASVDTSFRFMSLPSLNKTQENRVIIKNNLFYKVPKIFLIDQQIDSREIRSLFPQSEGNVQDPDSGEEGNMILKLRQFSFDLPLDPADPKFLSYPRTCPLSQMGPAKSPVGFPPS